MEKPEGIPSDVHAAGHPHPPSIERAGAPPAYTDCAYSSSNIPPPSSQGYPAYGYPAPGQYPPAGQGYPLAGQGYPPAGQGYPPAGQGYPPAGQGYPPAGQGYQGYVYPQQQQQFHSNVVVAQPLIQPQPMTGPPPPDHMCAAIFVTIFCFWPTGIVAIMRASEARNALFRGDVASAQAYANSAKSMITISVIIGVISVVVIGIIIGVYMGIILNSLNHFD